tara:strand:+ start:210 stop:386 length:177 start_codon:yes stop_codon:yes gene_type:complete
MIYRTYQSKTNGAFLRIEEVIIKAKITDYCTQETTYKELSIDDIKQLTLKGKYWSEIY